MPLDGLRAWIGEVERKLGMRTRVFLALSVIAIGGAAAGIYLAVDTNEQAVSEGDVRALQEKLEARINTAGSGTGATSVATLEAEVKALKGEVEALQGKKPKTSSSPGGASQPPASSGKGTTPPVGTTGPSSIPSETVPPSSGATGPTLPLPLPKSK